MSQAGDNGTHPDVSVVIVDDSTVIRQRVRALVNSLDGTFVAGEAGDATTGLEVTRSTCAEVVILDITMQGPSGLELLERLRALPVPPTVIMLTNYPYTAFRRRSAELGAEHFLAKATEFEQLRPILTRIAKVKAEEQVGGGASEA